MCYRTRATIVQGLQLKEKGILTFSSSCLCRSSEIGILSYRILSTQQLTVWNKSYLHRVHCFKGWHLWKTRVWVHTLQHPSQQWCWSGDTLPTHAHTHSPQSRDPAHDTDMGPEQDKTTLLQGALSDHCVKFSERVLWSTIALHYNPLYP